MSQVIFRNSKDEDVLVIDLETSKISAKEDLENDKVAKGFIACLEIAVQHWREKQGDNPLYKMIFKGGTSSEDAESGNFIFCVGDASCGNKGGDVAIHTGH